MNLEKYEYTVNETLLEYEFYSEGPKGRIKKIIYFQQLKYSGDNIFNLAFGDWLEKEQRVDDKATSNNNDREKILATVASTVLDFLGYHPGSSIYAEGSTKERTRLYQMGISAYLSEISKLLEIKGFIEDNWELFRKGRNYEAFAVRVKRIM